MTLNKLDVLFFLLNEGPILTYPTVRQSHVNNSDQQAVWGNEVFHFWAEAQKRSHVT